MIGWVIAFAGLALAFFMVYKVGVMHGARRVIYDLEHEYQRSKAEAWRKIEQQIRGEDD